MSRGREPLEIELGDSPFTVQLGRSPAELAGRQVKLPAAAAQLVEGDRCAVQRAAPPLCQPVELAVVHTPSLGIARRVRISSYA